MSVKVIPLVIVFVLFFFHLHFNLLLQYLNWIPESSKGNFCLLLCIFLLVAKAHVLCCFADITLLDLFSASVMC